MRRNQLWISYLLCLVMTPLGMGCDDDDDDRRDAGVASDGGDSGSDAGLVTIAALATADPNFSMLVAAVERADMSETLASSGPLTVFAPPNSAFQASGITMSDIESLPMEQLEAILAYHVVPGVRLDAAMLDPGAVDTAADLSIVIGERGTVTTLNGGNSVEGGANVVSTERASNGVVHVVDRVLLPPDVARMLTYAGLDAFTEALEEAGLIAMLQGPGPFTVFGPTDEAFAALPDVPTGDELRGVLLYHVVPGALTSADLEALDPPQADSLAENRFGNRLTILFDARNGVTINGTAKAELTDLRATNGVVHVVDQVLTPLPVTGVIQALGLSRLTDAAGMAAPFGDGTTLIDGLTEGTGPFTVFAPTNEALNAVDLAGLTPDQLRDMLVFHVLDPGANVTPVLSRDFPAPPGGERLTLLGVPAMFDTSVTPPTIQGVPIVRTDINALNGVVHVIQGVLIPPEGGF